MSAATWIIEIDVSPTKRASPATASNSKVHSGARANAVALQCSPSQQLSPLKGEPEIPWRHLALLFHCLEQDVDVVKAVHVAYSYSFVLVHKDANIFLCKKCEHMCKWVRLMSQTERTLQRGQPEDSPNRNERRILLRRVASAFVLKFLSIQIGVYDISVRLVSYILPVLCTHPSTHAQFIGLMSKHLLGLKVLRRCLDLRHLL